MSIELDQLDLQILNILQHNSRLTNKKIGEMLHKTTTPIFERRHRMEQLGVIRAYVAVLDATKINRSLLAFTHVQMKDHSAESLLAFEESIIAFDEVMECYHTSGQYDFILRIAVSSLPAYHDFLMNKLFKAQPVAAVLSTFVMKEAKAHTAYKLDLEEKQKASRKIHLK